MNIKDLFDKAENGTLTYEQFVAGMGQSKFVDLTDGNYVSRQKYTDDLSARDTRITSLDDTIKARDTDLASLRQQLQDAGNDTEKLTELNTAFSNLQSKYDKDTKAYQRQLKEQSYKFAVNRFADAQEFTSNAAKRDFITTMLGKNLQMDGDTILGATDFRTAYANDNADAFKAENTNEPPAPHFVTPTTPNGNTPPGDTNPFKFSFTGVRPH